MVREYLDKVEGTELFNELDEDRKDKIIFSASELLSSVYPSRKLTTRAIAMQVLYMLEAGSEEFLKYKVHGVNSISAGGVSLSLDKSLISPIVIMEIGEPRTARVGGLI